MSCHSRAPLRRAAGLALLGPLTAAAHALAPRPFGPVAVPATVADTGRFLAADSTLVVVVPSGAAPTGVLGAVRAVRGRSVTAVYTTDDRAALALGSALAGAVGASLIPYDRVGATTDAYAARLLRNAVGANPRGTVMIVGDAALRDPLYRCAAAASGIATPEDARAGGGQNGMLVLGVAPQHAEPRPRPLLSRVASEVVPAPRP